MVLIPWEFPAFSVMSEPGGCGSVQSSGGISRRKRCCQVTLYTKWQIWRCFFFKKVSTFRYYFYRSPLGRPGGFAQQNVQGSATVSVCLMGKMGFSVPSNQGFPHFTATDTVAQPRLFAEQIRRGRLLGSNYKTLPKLNFNLKRPLQTPMVIYFLKTIKNLTTLCRAIDLPRLWTSDD